MVRAMVVVLAVAVSADAAQTPLAGEWKLASARMSAANGVDLAAALRANVARVVIDADTITAGRPAGYTLDAGKRHIDVKIDGGPAAERGMYKGVYELAGDTLTLHLALPGKDRPTSIEPPPAGGSILIVLTKK